MQDILSTISLSMGASWASGINLYATLFMLGFLNHSSNITLPENLEILSNPVVMAAAGIMYVIEFFTDKIPGVDTAWDTLHSFIRIPAGAIMAATALGEISPAAQVAGAIVGGGLTATTHATKAGGRVLINTSPEPVTNWITSVTEDIAVIGGLYAALHYPVLFLILLVLFILLAIWLLPKILRGIKKVFAWIGRLLGLTSGDSKNEPLKDTENGLPTAPGLTEQPKEDISSRLESLETLKNKGQISESEYQALREKLLDQLTGKA